MEITGKTAEEIENVEEEEMVSTVAANRLANTKVEEVKRINASVSGISNKKEREKVAALFSKDSARMTREQVNELIKIKDSEGGIKQYLQ
jgi:nitrogenase subunit NifH